MAPPIEATVGLSFGQILDRIFSLLRLLMALLRISFVPPWSWIASGILALCGIVLLVLWMTAVWSGYAVTFAVLYWDQRRRLDARDKQGEAILSDSPGAA